MVEHRNAIIDFGIFKSTGNTREPKQQQLFGKISCESFRENMDITPGDHSLRNNCHQGDRSKEPGNYL